MDLKRMWGYIRAGKDNFDLLEIELALYKLQRAAEIGWDRNCDKTNVFAKALLSTGLIYLRGYEDRLQAKQYFVWALRAAPTVKMGANSPPKVQRIWRQVQAQCRPPARQCPVKVPAVPPWRLARLRVKTSPRPATGSGRRGSATKRARAKARGAARSAEMLPVVFPRTYGLSASTRLQRRQAERLWRLADRLLKRGQTADAYRRFLDLLRLDPLNVAARIRLGVLQAKLGDYGGALSTVKWVEKHAGEAAAERLRKLQRQALGGAKGLVARPRPVRRGRRRPPR